MTMSGWKPTISLIHPPTHILQIADSRRMSYGSRITTLALLPQLKIKESNIVVVCLKAISEAFHKHVLRKSFLMNTVPQGNRYNLLVELFIHKARHVLDAFSRPKRLLIYVYLGNNIT